MDARNLILRRRLKSIRFFILNSTNDETCKLAVKTFLATQSFYIYLYMSSTPWHYHWKFYNNDSVIPG